MKAQRQVDLDTVVYLEYTTTVSYKVTREDYVSFSDEAEDFRAVWQAMTKE